jgi:Tetratricopeptide repeat/LytR cell envelope-related transcriptional attenuator
MFKVKIIVLSVCGALSVASCTSLSKRADAPTPAQSAEYRSIEPEAMYRLGRYYQGQTRYVEAVLAYREALRLNPLLADAYNGLGVTYAEQGRYGEAVEALRTAVELSPTAAYLQGNLGYALLLIGSNEEALQTLERARSLDPTNEKVVSNVRLAQQRLEHLEERRSVAETPTVRDVPSQMEARIPVVTVDHAGVPTSDAKSITVSPNVYELQDLEDFRAAAAQPPDAMESSARVVNAELSQATNQKDDSPALQERHAAPRTFRLEISNGNGVTGLAKRVARVFDRHGFQTARVTNHKGFRQTTTVVQFRPGHSAEANEVRTMLSPEHVPIVLSDTLRSDIHVRVLLGKDLRSETALVPPDASVLMALQEHREQ